jgi:oligopeptide transport system permease protein
MMLAPSTADFAQSSGYWPTVARQLRRDRVAVACATLVAVFALVELAVAAGWLARNWQDEVAIPYAPATLAAPRPSGAAHPSEVNAGPAAKDSSDIADVDPLAARSNEWRSARRADAGQGVQRATARPLGADRLGRDLLTKTLQAGKTSIFVGVVAALMAVMIGTVLGALAGYFRGALGDALEWLYNVFESIPSLLLIFALAAVLSRGIATVVLILGLTGWTGLYRAVRAEYLRHRVRPYVLSAAALGVSHWGRIFRHILPNVAHVILVRLSLLVVAFIKAEVILSFLGFGVPAGGVSWGTMIAESQSEILLGRWWQLVAAGVPMALFVTAFSMFTDSLRDAMDPRLT